MGLMDFLNRGSKMSLTDDQRDGTDDRYFGGRGARSEIGVTVTIDRARQVPVVRDCLKILSSSVAGLQFGVFKKVDQNKTERADDHPIVKLLQNPNRRQTSFDFIDMIVDDLCTAGDFHAEKIYDDAGNIVELRRMEPEKTLIEEAIDWSKRFQYTDRKGETRVLLEEEVWHIPLPPLVDNMVGTSPILKDGREAIAVAIALQQYSNILFTNDATPPYVWSMPVGQSFKSSDDKKNFLKAIQKWMSGGNRHRPAVTEYGIEPKRMGLTAEEAQFLDTRKELWLDLTRLWRVPPHKVGILDRATFSNIESQSLEFVTDTLRPILEMIERSVNKFLIDDQNYYFEFNVESLLRGDLKARYEAYAEGRQWGWLSVNDILLMENKNGIGPAGDRYIEPLNMVPVGTGEQQRGREAQLGVQQSIAFLRESVAANGGRPRLEIIKNAA
jgi:HK97 family phage portal protein